MVLVALVLVAMMSLALVGSALADDTITINLKPATPGTETGETLTGYKIFDVVKSSGVNAANDNSGASGFAYTIAADSVWLSAVQGLKNSSDKNYFVLTAAADGLTYSVALNTADGIANSEATAKEIAAKLLAAMPNSAPSIFITSGSANNATPGYYLITSPLGENLVLATTDITITEKNDYPSVVKEDDKADDTAKIGEDVVYTIEVTVPAKADNTITLTDTMTSGLTFKGDSLTSVTLTNASGTAIPAHVDAAGETPATYGYTFTKTDAQHFTVVFDAEYVKAHQGDKFVVVYTATVNKDAIVGVIEDENGNKNDVVLTYSNYSQTDTEPLETYQYEVVKVDGSDNTLQGAEFTLWTALTGGSQIGVVQVSEGDPASPVAGKYRLADATETAITGNMTTDDNGKLTIVGLGNGKYYLQEDVAPLGYNKLAARQEVEIATANKTATVASGKWTAGDKVVNNSGTELPSTGGVGTTIFYAVGLILVVGAAVILVARRKADAE